MSAAPPEPATSALFRLRATAPGSSAAASSSMLRVARIAAVARAAPVLQAHHAPRQLAFDFHRGAK